jgi:hypothetical protein
MWKNIIETSLNIPFHQLKYMPNDILKSSGMDQDILRLDESAVCTFVLFTIDLPNPFFFFFFF